MKSLVIAVSCLLLATVAASAGGVRAGVFGGYTLGGDISEENPAYGAQVIYDIVGNLSAELAVARLKDEASESGMGIDVSGDVDITPITLSARYAVPVVRDRLLCYGLAGIGYYMYDASMDIDMSGVADAFGAPGLAGTGDVDLKVDDAIGYHVGAGVEWRVQEHVELFADYRYAFVKTDVSMSASVTTSYQGRSVTEELDEDSNESYNLGLLRVGVNYRF